MFKPGAKRQEPYEQILDEERLILAATELIIDLMGREGVTRSELATKICRSKGHVSQLLSGERNLTLRTFAGLAHALGYQVQLDALPIASAAHQEPVRPKATPPISRYRRPASEPRLGRPKVQSECGAPLVAA